MKPEEMLVPVPRKKSVTISVASANDPTFTVGTLIEALKPLDAACEVYIDGCDCTNVAGPLRDVYQGEGA